MIKNKKFIYIAFILLLMSMILNFPFPNKNPFGETIFLILNIPLSSVNGFDYVGITSLFLLIICLYFLVNSLNKYHSRFVVITIIVAIFIPPFVVSSFQKTFATGIYAVSYSSDKSSCIFEKISEKTLHGQCELPLENHSKNDVQFTLEFYEEYTAKDDLQMVTLMNNNSPYKVRLKGKESKRVTVETNINVSKMVNPIESGGVNVVNIIIKSRNINRKL